MRPKVQNVAVVFAFLLFVFGCGIMDKIKSLGGTASPSPTPTASATPAPSPTASPTPNADAFAGQKDLLAFASGTTCDQTTRTPQGLVLLGSSRLDRRGPWE